MAILNYQEVDKLIWSRRRITQNHRTISGLMQDVRTFDDPRHIKTTTMSIFQLYFDAIVDHGEIEGCESRQSMWEEQNKTLENLCDVGRECVREFYEGREKISDVVRSQLIEQEKTLFKYIWPHKMSRISHLLGQEPLIVERIKNIKKNIRTPIDTLVPVASEGFEPAFLLYTLMGNAFRPVRYSKDKEDATPLTPLMAREDYMKRAIEDKNVLVMEGTVCTGRSITEVIEFVKHYSPKNLFAAAMMKDGPLLEVFPEEEFIDRNLVKIKNTQSN